MDCELCSGDVCFCDFWELRKEMEEFTKGFSEAFKEPRYTDILGMRKDLNKLEDMCIERWKELKREVDEIKSRQKKEKE